MRGTHLRKMSGSFSMSSCASWRAFASTLGSGDASSPATKLDTGTSNSTVLHATQALT